MKLSVRFVVALGVGSCLPIAAQAQIPLSDLISGAQTITINGPGYSLQFGNWGGFSSAASGGAVAPLASQIFVLPVGAGTLNPGLLYTSAVWNTITNQTIDTSFRYDVFDTQNRRVIKDASARLVAFDTRPDGRIVVLETLTDADDNLLGSMNLDTDIPRLFDEIQFSPVSRVKVAKDIALFGGRIAGSRGSMSDFEQRFSIVPEPTSMIVLGASLVALAVRRRRKA